MDLSEVILLVYQPRVAAVFAVTAYGTNVVWGCDFGYPLQPSELSVERDLELSTRFTYSE